MPADGMITVACARCNGHFGGFRTQQDAETFYASHREQCREIAVDRFRKSLTGRYARNQTNTPEPWKGIP